MFWIHTIYEQKMLFITKFCLYDAKNTTNTFIWKNFEFYNSNTTTELMVTAKYSDLCVTGEMKDSKSFGFAVGDYCTCGDPTHKWCKIYEQPRSHSYA